MKINELDVALPILPRNYVSDSNSPRNQLRKINKSLCESIINIQKSGNKESDSQLYHLKKEKEFRQILKYRWQKNFKKMKQLLKEGEEVSGECESEYGSASFEERYIFSNLQDSVKDITENSYNYNSMSKDNYIAHLGEVSYQYFLF